jgi:hypothetical protein
MSPLKATVTAHLLGLGLVLLLCTGTAQAQIAVRAQVDGSIFLDEYARAETAWEADGGVGITGLVGYRLDLGLVVLTPEVGFNVCWFTDPYERDTVRVFGGGRLSLPWRVEPSTFVHLGWGTADGIDQDAVLHRDGLTLAAGLGADLRLVGGWSVGLQAGYNALWAETGSGTEATHWVSFGANAGLIF